MKPIERRLRRNLRALRSKVPPVWPVVVRRRRIVGHWGTVNLVKEPSPHFVLNLDPALAPDRLDEVLIHEWAHALSWTTEHPSVQDHGPEWGISYAKTYTALLD